MTLAAGSNLGAYRIIEPLGRGGMASVFRAYEAGLDRYVALKVLPREFMHDATFAERFKREARMLAGLEHPNIVPIHAYGIDDGIPWMAMRLVTGGTLASLARKGRLDPSRVLGILKGVAEALDYAHARGVIHRDIKPQNVLLDEGGRVYLADFGIARMVDGNTMLTQTGVITGTPQYMAPEQAMAEALDGRCDVYALGIITYELLTGHVPFSADTPVAVLMKHMTEPIPLQPLADVPEPLMRAVLKAVAKKPVDRFPSAGAYAAALGEALAGPAYAEVPTVDLPTASAGAPTASLPGTASLPRTVPSPRRSPLPPTRTAERPQDVTAPPRTPTGESRSGLGAGMLAGLLGGAGLLLALVVFGAWKLVGMWTPAAATPAAAVVPKAPASPPASGPTPSPLPNLAPSPLPPAAGPSAPQSGPLRTAASSPQPTGPSVKAAPVGSAEPARTRPADPPRAPANPVPPKEETPAAFGSLRIAIDAQRVVAGARALPLYVRVTVGDQAKNTAIFFLGRPAGGGGANALPFPYSGSETVEIERLPTGPHQVQLLVGAERSLSDGVRGTAEVTIRPGWNTLNATVRFAGPREREVRLR